YLDALSIKYHGVGVWQMYVPTAMIGVLTVIAIYFATQSFFGRLAGVLAGLFAATSAWHVTISRTGFRAILAPLFLAAFTAFVGYAIASAKDRKVKASYMYAVLAGISFAGGFYSYIAYRAMIGVVLGIVVLLLLASAHKKVGFPHFRRYGGQMVAGLLSALVVLAPLAGYFFQHPEAFMGRAGQVSIFNPDLQRQVGVGSPAEALVYSTRESLKGFFVGDGDGNWRHSVAGYPLLNPLVGLLFLFGFAWTLGGTVGVLWRFSHGEEVHLGMVYPYLLLLFVGMLLPVVTTAEGIPHGLRSLGMCFPIMVLAGTAGAVVVHWIQRRLTSELMRSVGYGLVAGALIIASVYDGALYFFVARNTAPAHAAYRADLTEVTKFLTDWRQQNPGSPRPYLVLDAFSAEVVHFLQHEIHPDGSTAPPPHGPLTP
ncbi:MAG: glycosyltransferase family 39 protein, partial [Patescibacteria group bacterium]